MRQRTTRRRFLAQGGRAIVGTSLLSMAGCSDSITPREAQVSGTLTDELDAQIPSLLRDARVPGLSIAMVRDGRLAWARGFGVKRSGSNDPVDENTLFEAGSVSNSYLQLVVAHLTGRVSTEACETLFDGLSVCATEVDSYLKTSLLRPFGMATSGYVWEAASSLVAAGHDRDGAPTGRAGMTPIIAARYSYENTSFSPRPCNPRKRAPKRARNTSRERFIECKAFAFAQVPRYSKEALFHPSLWRAEAP